MQLITVRPDWLTTTEMKLFHRAFQYAQSKLDLTSHTETVQVRFDPYIVARGDGAAFIDNFTRDPICMSIGKQSISLTMSALFHEMTHVKQRVKGELEISTETESFRFKGRYFYRRDLPKGPPGVSRPNDPEYKKYRDLPWEAEAFQMQETLTKGFIETLTPDECWYLLQQELGRAA